MKVGHPDVWNDDDIPGDGFVMKTKDLVFWDAVLEDSAKMAKKTDDIGKSHVQRLRKWLLAQYGPKDDDDDDEGEPPISARCQADMTAQGASKPSDLGYGEVSLFMGRSATLGEYKGWLYGGPPQRSVGGKDVVKQKTDNFDDVLKRGILARDSSGVDAWISRTTNHITASDHPFAPSMASRTLQWWLRAKSTLKDERALLHYVSEYRLERTGRLFPELFDAEIAQRAMNMAAAGELAGSQASGGPADKKVGAANQGGAHAIDNQSDEILEQLTKLATSVNQMSGKVQSVSDRMAKVEEKIKTRPFVPSGDRKCFRCDSTEHSIADCPEKEGYVKPKK
jgi:hypothetical protein